MIHPKANDDLKHKNPRLECPEKKRSSAMPFRRDIRWHERSFVVGVTSEANWMMGETLCPEPEPLRRRQRVPWMAATATGT